MNKSCVFICGMLCCLNVSGSQQVPPVSAADIERDMAALREAGKDALSAARGRQLWRMTDAKESRRQFGNMVNPDNIAADSDDDDGQSDDTTAAPGVNRATSSSAATSASDGSSAISNSEGHETMQKVLNGISNIVASISLTLNEVKQNQSNSVSKKEFQDLQTSISGSLQTMATEIQQLNFAISGLRGSVDTLTIAKRGRAPVAQPSVIPVQVMPPQPTVQLMQPVPVQPANAGSLATSGRFGGAPEGVTSSISSGSSRSASEVLSRESSEGQSEGAANAFKLPDDVWTALSNPKKKPGARAKKAMTEFSSAVALIQKLSPDSLRKQGATEADLEEVYEKLEGWNKLCSDDIATVFNAFATALGKSAETRTNVEESSTRTTSEKTKASRRKRP